MARRHLHSRTLHESTESPGGLTVDPKAGVIHGVKVLGFESANGRRYTETAMLAAIPLYEGAKVNLDHPSDSDEPRSVADRIGKLTGVHFREGQGLFASLRYNPAKPFAKELEYWARHMPECLGLSHNASGRGVDEPDGTFVVHQITEVKSVDLVADPATTRSLSEGIDMSRRTATRNRKTIEGKARKAAEEFDLLEGEESDNPAAQDSKDDMKTTILAILAGEGDDTAKAEKLAELMAGGHTPEADEPDEEEEEITEEDEEDDLEEPEEEDEEEGPPMKTREHREGRESPEVRKLREQVAALQTARAIDKKQAWVRSLAESKGVRLDRTTLNALMALPSKPLIEGMVGKLAAAAKAPRSGWVPLLEGESHEPQGPSIPKGTEERANWLRG